MHMWEEQNNYDDDNRKRGGESSWTGEPEIK